MAVEDKPSKLITYSIEVIRLRKLKKGEFTNLLTLPKTPPSLITFSISMTGQKYF